MKKILLPVIALSLVFLSSFIPTNTAGPVMFKLVSSSSSLAWTSNAEDGTTHKGALKLQSGNLKFDSQTLLSGYALINMQSLSCSDIKDEGFNRELIVEMRSPEQLNLAKYKQASLKIIKSKRLDVEEGKPNYDISGTVKIKDKAVKVKFTATIKKTKKGATLKGDFVLPKAETELPYDLNLAINMTTKLSK